MAKNNSSTPRKKETGEGKSKQSHGTSAPEKKKGGKERSGASFAAQFSSYALGVAAIFIAVCLISGKGVVGAAIKAFLLGMNGAVAFALPAFIVIHIVTLSSDLKNGNLPLRAISSAVTYLFISALVHLIAGEYTDLSIAEHYVRGKALSGGGAAGGLLCSLLMKGFGRAGTVVIVVAILIVSVLLLFGFTPKAFGRVIAEAAARRAEKRAEKHEREQENEERYGEQIRIQENAPDNKEHKREKRRKPERVKVEPAAPVRFRYKRKKPFTPDIPLDDDYPEEGKEDETDAEERVFEEAMERTRMRRLASGDEYETPTAARISGAKKGEEQKNANAPGEPHEKVGPDGSIAVKRTTVSRPESAPKGESSYVFPPINLLPEDTGRRDPGVREELHEKGEKLVETLRSFNVRTRIEDISRGPTITRYELLPEPGTRVRSIVNLVDDISLNLATTGVRIEAPVPGKAVVGIEVPNNNKSTVYLRTLIDEKKFRENTSKLFCALGEDVAGEAVYLDIEKMPHLLIAGATGMGKSVCINSLIVSLLYKSTPEEVKLILIDPKKVELNVYNGIPHLLVPVVTDPKKAAGSLSWAVSEMERRFGLIEAVGVRDVTAFNRITAKDPDYEYLPYIVIIIDELADLMMTAPDNVEDSICRLMQKARAAGMHVIVGTQRPSVDVITGLIKANIPSRIAFTVASQVDSRTILDRAGAENLIGRGDMLYLPVSASKPIRVQGAFVHEDDVEKIVSFIKEKGNGDAAYSKEVIDKIEEAAKNVGNKKKSVGTVEADQPDSDDDPMLRDAIELKPAVHGPLSACMKSGSGRSMNRIGG